MRTVILLLLVSNAVSITPSCNAATTGLVNFNLGESPVSDSPIQAVTLYGCNEVIHSDLFWETDNQIIGNIPYGWRESESDKPYYISKYYIASPPVFRKESAPDAMRQRPYIGLVTPDNFIFNGNKPARIVYFDYRILQPTYLTHVAVDYDGENNDGLSCKDLGVDGIPVNTQCEDFPWRNGAEGAAGIGEVTAQNNRIFLPLAGEQKTPLQCKVSILDDIILEHDIYFVTSDGKKTKTTDLTLHHNDGKAIKLICYQRPAGNRPPGCSP